MKVLVRSTITKKYWANDGTWTDGISEARIFDRSSSAVLACADQGLKNAEIVLIFSEKRYDSALFDRSVGFYGQQTFAISIG